MKFHIIFLIFALQISSNLAINRTEVEKQLEDLESHMRGQYIYAKLLTKQTIGDVNITLNELSKHILLTRNNIGNINAAKLTEWELKANFSGVEIKECVPILKNLTVIDKALFETTTQLINNEYKNYAQKNDELIEKMQDELNTGAYKLEDELKACKDTDEKCLEKVSKDISDYFATFMDITTKGLETSVQWFLDVPVYANVQKILKQFKVDSLEIDNKMIACIKEKLHM